MVHPGIPQRRMNAELIEGATDGGYKKVVQNRGGVVESTTWESREPLDDVWHGIHERPLKQVPGRFTDERTPYYTPTREPDSTKW